MSIRPPARLPIQAISRCQWLGPKTTLAYTSPDSEASSLYSPRRVDSGSLPNSDRVAASLCFSFTIPLSRFLPLNRAAQRNISG